jgi:1-acyl-sn-glycerol-3-phosphate acyltransferase
VIGLIEQELHKNRGVMLFAEGTSSQGADVLPFLPSLLEPAARIDFPVSYVTITYCTPPGQPPASQSVCWSSKVSFRKHFFALLELPSFHATVRFGAQPIRDRNRKVLAKKLHQAVREQFQPLVQE